MVKYLPQILYNGIKIFIRSLNKSIQEEIQLSQEAAKIRYNQQASDSASKEPLQMNLDEAKLILNVNKLCPKEIEERYQYLFHVNSKEQAGSVYLQSKVLRAKQRLDVELNKDTAIESDLSIKPKSKNLS
ncbi:unnamed protein product [Acanthoscelides obtectus]|uniref:Mitochondrial import inner membrane translocase subunit TIM16 n=1 Tax=Acanthoscelides obtectus TaxID=200917 RepID=A0A9P0KJ36_ACAOB|nr:unnamed protein product [Acanthoscelides obtectus]CAK1651976.1 Mitochondrial import inner membrane translocase subunit tim16-B [Acanthoscelides obtectus]